MDLLINIFNIATAVIALASTVTALTVTPKDDALISKAYKYLEYLALVVGKAKQ